MHKESIEEKPEEIFEDRIVSGLPEVAMDIPTFPGAYQNVFRLPGYTLKIRCYDKEFGTMVDQYQLLALYFIKTDEVFRLIK